MSINNTEGLEVISWSRVYKATQEDKMLVKLIEEIKRGVPESRYDLEKELRQFHKYRHNLHVVAGVVCYKDRIVIPKVLREEVLAGIHAAHQGDGNELQDRRDRLLARHH